MCSWSSGETAFKLADNRSIKAVCLRSVLYMILGMKYNIPFVICKDKVLKVSFFLLFVLD